MATRIRRSAAPTSAVALIDLAGQLGLELSDAYRDWLLDTNGGVPDRPRFHFTSGKGKQKSARVLWLFPAGRDGLVEMTATDLLTAHQQRPVGLPAGLLPVGDADTDMNTGRVCLMCGGPDAGKVFYRPDVESTKETAHPVADSWPAFLAGLMWEDGKPPKPWRQAVWDGDVPALKAILDKGGKWKDDYSTRLDIYREVIEEGSWPLTELLLSYPGFEAGEIFEEALQNDRLVLAAQFLDRGLVTAVKPKLLLEVGVSVWHAPPLLRALLERGADPTAEDDGGSTPLHKAVEVRAAEAVDILLTAGADPTAKDDDGRTPQKLARRLEETALAGRLAAAELAWKNRPAPVEQELEPFDLSGFTFQYPGTPLTLADIKAFEAEQKLELPAAYRWFLTQTNGGSPQPGLIPFDRLPRADEEDEDEDEEYQRPDAAVRFLPLREKDGAAAAAAAEKAGHEESYQFAYPVEEARGWYHDGGEIPRGTLPIACLANYGVDDQAFILIGLKGRDRGKILVYDYGSSKLVNSLAAFFALLRECGNRPKTVGELFADAVDAGDVAAAVAIIHEGEPIPFDCRDGRLPIRAACQRGLDDIVFALAEAGHKLDDLLTQASYAGRTALMRRLLGVGKGPSKEGVRMILWCDQTYHDPELLAALDARGLKWDKLLKGKESCLASAAGSGSVAGLQFLLDRGGDVNQPDHNGSTPLHHAARCFRPDPDQPDGPRVPDPDRAAAMVRFLLERGAAVNRTDESGQTALHYAVEQGNVAAAKLLIDAGEDLFATHEAVPPGMTPEQARKQAEKMAKMAQKMFGEIGKGLPADDEDLPAIDTSEPAGEKAAETMGLIQKAQQAMGGMLDALGSKVAAMAAGSWGRGPSAADHGRRRGQAAAVAELEAYQKAKG